MIPRISALMELRDARGEAIVLVVKFVKVLVSLSLIHIYSFWLFIIKVILISLILKSQKDVVNSKVIYNEDVYKRQVLL